MKPFWLTFTDGSHACCEGQTDFHAKEIAEKLTGKTVAGGSCSTIAAKLLPYPANPIIWQFDDPVIGKCPVFCHTPESCAGEGACRRAPACTE